MKIITAEEVARSLDWNALIDRIAAAFISGVEAPPRHHHIMQRPDGDATMLLMPAWQADGYIGVKMVNVFPQNTAQGLPGISGVYLLSEGQHGRPLACIEGSELTRRRTAAASALAARWLAREDAYTLLVVGTGKLAPMLIEAHAAVRPIGRVLIWGRTKEKAAALAEAYQDRFEVAVATDLESSAAHADIISCATFASTALVKGAWLQPGTHLDLVGAFRPSMREADGEAMSRARVYVDTMAGAQGEAGDIIQAIEEGALSWDDIQGDLKQLLTGEVSGRHNDEEITLFKSTGASLEDLAAAIEVWEKYQGQ